MAQWKKLLSRIATYKKKGDRHSRENREGSPIPGVELYDATVDGSDLNIAIELVNEGHAKVVPNFGDLSRSHVLRLDGDSSASSSERLNDLSSASTATDTISSIVSTINTSRKALQESVSEEATSTTSPGSATSKIGNGDAVQSEMNQQRDTTKSFPGVKMTSNGTPKTSENFLQAEKTNSSLRNESSNDVTNNSYSSGKPDGAGLPTRDRNALIVEEQQNNGLIH